MSNHQQQWPKKKRQQGYGEFLCKPCNTRFVSFDRLMKHKGEKRKAGSLKHIHCRLCGIDFKTEREEHEHIQEVCFLLELCPFISWIFSYTKKHFEMDP